MPRAERPLDPDAGPLTRFAADLRKLREAAGRPSCRALAKRAHYSSTTLSDAAGGRTFPSLSVTLAYVEACQGDCRAWEARWHAVAAEMAAGAPADEPGEAGPQGAPYAGLAAFQPEDADRFFGRERLTGEVLAKVRDRRFLAVFGPSGSGSPRCCGRGSSRAYGQRGGRCCSSRRGPTPWRSARSAWPRRRVRPPAR